MPMHLTCLKRSACRISAFIVLLSGAMPVAALAASDSVTKKELSAPVAQKAMPAAAAASTEPAAKKKLPAPVEKKSVSASVAKKKSPRLFAKKALPKAVRRTHRPVPFAFAMNAPSLYRVPLGESKVYRFAQPIKRIAVGDPKVADYIMLNRFEIYLLGKKLGSTNLVAWDQQGNVTSTPVLVSRGTITLQSFVKALFPKEKDIHIHSLGQALILSGSVSDAMIAESVSRVVTAYLGGSVPSGNPESALIGSDSSALKGIISENNKVSVPITVSVNGSNMPANAGSAGADSTRGLVNLLTVRNLQQVRLEVHIAQVSKTYLESLGLSVYRATGDVHGSLNKLSTGFVSDETLSFLLNPGTQITMGAKRKPSLFKVLAEPTIVTMSGKEGYFLVGGKVFVPVSIDRLTNEIHYEAQIYGVGLRFMPIVQDADRILLKVVSEVSQPDTEGVTAGTATTWPAFKMNTVSTNVQMSEGQNLVIGGLKLDNFTNTIDAVPLLGEIPILGALFRNTQKDSEKTELMVIVRPTLVKASTTVPELPTDKVAPPTRGELFLGGKLEGSQKK